MSAPQDLPSRATPSKIASRESDGDDGQQGIDSGVDEGPGITHTTLSIAILLAIVIAAAAFKSLFWGP